MRKYWIRQVKYRHIPPYLSLPCLSLPHLTLSLLTLPLLTLPYLTSPCLSSPYLTLPLPFSPHPILPHLTLPCLTMQLTTTGTCRRNLERDAGVALWGEISQTHSLPHFQTNSKLQKAGQLQRGGTYMLWSYEHNRYFLRTHASKDGTDDSHIISQYNAVDLIAPFFYFLFFSHLWCELNWTALNCLSVCLSVCLSSLLKTTYQHVADHYPLTHAIIQGMDGYQDGGYNMGEVRTVALRSLCGTEIVINAHIAITLFSPYFLWNSLLLTFLIVTSLYLSILILIINFFIPHSLSLSYSLSLSILLSCSCSLFCSCSLSCSCSLNLFIYLPL